MTLVAPYLKPGDLRHSSAYQPSPSGPNSAPPSCEPSLDAETVRRFLAYESEPGALPEPQWGPIGREVYERTYSRTKGDGSKEVWAETARRVVLGNLAFAPLETWLPGEAVELFEMLYSFKVTPAGRHLWTTGTNVRFNRNCFASGFSERTSEHVAWTAQRLFEGGGVGGNYSADLIAVTSPILGAVDAQIACDPAHPDFGRVALVAETAGAEVWNMADPDEGTVIRIEDTRESWVDAWSLLIDTATEPGAHRLIFDVSDIRPYGAALRTMGGQASGPAPLVEAIIEIASILRGAVGRRLRGLEYMDLDHAVAASVIAGGTRRSARMSLMHWNDPDIFQFIDCKADPSKHWTTNISIETDSAFAAALTDGDPHAERVLSAVATGMALNGEPGFIDTEAHSVGERTRIRGVNPCVTGETLVAVADGRGSVSIKDLADAGDDVPVYTYDQETGRPVVRTMRAPRMTGEQVPVVKVTLDSGDSLTVTPNHKFVLRDGTKVRADELAAGSSLRLLSRYQSSFVPGGVVSVEPAGYADVYNGTVDEHHTYFIGGFETTTASGRPKQQFVLTANCGEVSLNPWESCNIGSINLDAYGCDFLGALRAFELMARFLYRATIEPYPDERSREVESRNRRIGLGVLGFQGWCAAHGVKLAEFHRDPALRAKLIAFRLAARAAADRLADALGTPHSIKVTAIAPTGSISQLSGATAGIHPVFFKHFIRRVRYSDTDPQLAGLAKLGYTIVDDVYAANTKVVEFPVKDAILDRFPEHLIQDSTEIDFDEFMLMVKAVQDTLLADTDGNAVSATAQIPGGMDPAELAEALRRHVGTGLKGITAFPSISRPLSPLEGLTKEQYDSALRDLDESAAFYAAVGDSNSGQCATGACPVR